MASSAGLLMYRKGDSGIEIFLVHPGGPFFKNKDDGYWTIPKGLQEEDEDLQDTAIREFREETGLLPEGPYIALGEIIQKGGKRVYAWAFEGNMEHSEKIVSNLFSIEWPPRSGKFKSFPEIDKASFFNLEEAEIKINAAQVPFIKRLLEYIL